MGCNNSNLRRPSTTNITAEERILQSHERNLFFSNKKLEDLLSSIESISFPLDQSNFPALCEVFKIPPSSPSGHFFHNLLEKKQLTSRVLRHLTILLSESRKLDKMSLISSLDKKSFLSIISDLLHLSIEVIPQNIENIDRSVIIYTQSLKPIADDYMNELKKLSVEEIESRIQQLLIFSRELRYKMYVDLLHSKMTDGFDSKLDTFHVNSDEKLKVDAELDDFHEKIEEEVKVIEKNQELETEIKVEVVLEDLLTADSNKVHEKELKSEDKDDENESSESISSEAAQEVVEVEVEEKSQSENNEFIKVAEEVDEKKAEVEDKIPEVSEEANLVDESLLLPLNDSDIKTTLSSDLILEDPKPEPEPVEEGKAEGKVVDEFDTKLLGDPKPETVEEHFPEEMKSEDSSLNKSNDSETKSKIPMRMSSGLASKLKLVQPFIRSSTMGKEPGPSNINIALSSSHKVLTFSKSKLSGDAVSAHSAIPLESSLSESSLLRSSLKPKSEEEKPQLKQEAVQSKIGVLKGKKK